MVSDKGEQAVSSRGTCRQKSGKKIVQVYGSLRTLHGRKLKKKNGDEKEQVLHAWKQNKCLLYSIFGELVYYEVRRSLVRHEIPTQLSWTEFVSATKGYQLKIEDFQAGWMN